MFNRIIPTACVCLAVSLSASGQNNQGSGYVFELPGPTSASGQFYYSVGTATAFPTSPTAAPSGPAGLFQIIPRPDGGQFYLVNPGNLQTVDPTFTHFGNVTLDQPPTAVTVTPDGKHVLVGTDQFYIIDATTNQSVANLPLPGPPNFSSDQPSGSPPCPSCWIAVSPDSSTAYVLTNGSNPKVTAFNLNTHTQITSPPALSLPFADATGIAISPLGLLYVTAANRIYEINPATLTITPGGTVQLSFWPARLKFTPDGTTAFAVNYTPATGGESLMEFTPANYGVSYWPAFNAILHPFVPGTPSPTFSDVFVASNSRAFALSSANPSATLYDVSFSPLNAAVSLIGANTNVPVNNVNSAAISNEVPAAQYLYLLNNQNVVRISLGASNAAASQTNPSSTGTLEFVLVPPETGAASFLQFNNHQTPAAGAISAPLIARVLNSAGQPVFNTPVSFAPDATSATAGLVVQTPNATSNADGYVQTTVTAPTAAGNYNVIATAGAATATFALTVACTGTACSSGTGTGTGNGSSQVTIVSGNGQLVPSTSPICTLPLFLQVTDTSGSPLQGVQVTFTSTTGLTNLFPSTATTDKNGLASTSCGVQSLTGGPAFQPDTIQASTPYGLVNFTVTQVQVPPNATETAVVIEPSNLVNPNDTTNTFNVAEGSVLQNAFAARVHTNIGVSTAIPGVGMDILAPDQITSSTAAKCQAAPVSDATGTVTCSIVAACQAPGVSQVYFEVGGYTGFAGAINITPGTASKLNKTSGDAQHGTPGQTLPLALQVTVTDACGSPAPGNTVKWSVSPSNGGTLVNTTTVSNSSGQVSTQVTLGQVAGTVTVTASFGTSTAAFTLTNQIVASGISLVSGGGQTALVGQGFAQPVVFLAHDASGNPVAGAAVNFSATNGATVSPGSGFTNAQGLASITVTAGTGVGNVVVTATLGSFSTTATLTVQPPGPAITASSFVNSASGAVGLVACGLGSVFGNGIAPNVQGVVSGLNPIGPLPYSLPQGATNGFSMTINNIPVPIQALANQNGQQQANFQTPCEVQPGPATVVVTANGATVTVTGVQVLQAQPGQYPSPVQGTAGVTYGAIISATDGSLVTLTNPAHRGQNYYLIATGLGQVSPAAQTDSVGVAGQNVVLPVVVGIDDRGVPVISAQYAQGAIGAYLVEFQIPSDAPTGTNQHLALAVTINNQLVFGNTLTLPAVQ